MSDAKNSLKSSAFMEVVEIVSEGEIEGWANATDRESIYFDGTPILENGVTNFENVQIKSNKGTNSQPYLKQILDEGTVSTIGYDQLVTNLSGPVTKSTSLQPLADKARITIQLPGGIYHTQSDGDIKRHDLNLMIEVKASDSPTFERVELNGRDSFYDKTQSPYERSYLFDLTQFGAGPYSVKMTKLSGDEEGKNVNVLAWKSMSLIISNKLRYPNSAVVKTVYDAKTITSIPNRGFEIYGLKIAIPNNYDPITRTYTGLWDGGMVTAWTDNPAWIYYDMIVNPRYGLGELIDSTSVNKVQLYAIGKYCDELIDRGDGVMEPRFTCSLYLQSAADAYKVITDLASVFRGMIYYTNGEIYTVQDSPADAVTQYTPSNVIDGMFNYTSTPKATRYSVALVKWNNPDDGFKIETEYVENPFALARYGLIEKDVAAIGCLSRWQAHRVGKYVLLTSQMETEVVAFKVGLDSLFAMPGQITRVYDPLKSTTATNGGRIGTATTTTVTLDREVTLQVGETYTFSLVQPDGVLADVSVSSSAGIYAAGDPITFTPAFAAQDVPLDESVWVLLADSHEWRLYRVLGITEEKSNNNGYFTMSCSRYDPDKLAAVDDTIDLGEVPPPTSDLSGIKPVSALSIIEGIVARADSIDRYIDVSWQPSPGPYLARYKIEWFGPDGFKIITSETPQIRVSKVSAGEHSFTVFAIDIGGNTSTGLNGTVIIDDLPPIELITVTGLELVGQGLDYEFQGRDPAFAWRSTSIVEEEIGEETLGGGTGSDPWFQDYEVRIYDKNDVLLRVDHTTLETYTYFYEFNLEDGGPNRELRIDVSARDAFGRIGPPTSITVINTPPINFGSLSITTGFEVIYISFIKPPDRDYVSTRVYLSQAQGFTPASNNLVYDESASNIILQDLIEETYYLRLEGVDEFGPSGVYTSEYLVTIFSVDRLHNQLGGEIAQSWLRQDLSDKIDTGFDSDEIYAAIQAESDARVATDGALSVEYTMKLDGNGHVAGIGIAVSGDASGPITSQMIMMADQFAVTYPSPEFKTNQAYALGQYVRATDVYIEANFDPLLVFRVTTAGTTGATEPSWTVQEGATYDSGDASFLAVIPAELVPFIVGTVNGSPAVIMDVAFIGDATIGSAHIGDLNVDRLTSGVIDVGAGGYIRLGDESFELSSELKRLTVTDQQAVPVERVKLGKLGPTADEYGIEIYNDEGVLLFSSHSGIDFETAGLGAFAGLDELTAANISTYVAAAAITNAYIGDIIQSANFSLEAGNTAGWRIDKEGVIVATDLLLLDSDGNVIISSSPTATEYGANLANDQQAWSDVSGTGRPDDDADVTGSNTALNINNQGNLATLDLVTGTYIANLTVDTLKITSGAITVNSDVTSTTQPLILSYPNYGVYTWSTLVPILEVPFNVGSNTTSQVWFSYSDIDFILQYSSGNWSFTGQIQLQVKIGSVILYSEILPLGTIYDSSADTFNLHFDGRVRGIAASITGNVTGGLYARVYGYCTSCPAEFNMYTSNSSRYLSLTGFKK